MTTRLIAAALCALLLIPAAAGAQPSADKPGKGNHAGQGPDGTPDLAQDCDGGTVEYDGPTDVWPPNHKLIPADLTFTPDTDDMYSYSAMAGHDQVVDGEELNGSGNTPFETDIAFVQEDGTTTQMIMGMETGEQTFPMQVRAERSGRDMTGRTYTIAGMVTYGMGEPCDFAFEITVPHDQGKRGGPALLLGL